MATQTLTIAGRRFVVLPERDYLKLQANAGKPVTPRPRRTVNPEFAADAMRELQGYRRTRKATKWSDVKAKLGL